MNVEMVIGVDKGQVIQRFKEPLMEVRYDPENMISVAEAMTKAAFEARDGIKPVGDALKAELVERHRMTLTQRVSLMLNSLRDDKTKTNGVLAKTLVDAMLAEVF